MGLARCLTVDALSQGNGRELLVRSLFLVKVVIEEAHDVIVPERVRQGDQRTVAGDLIVLDRLRRPDGVYDGFLDKIPMGSAINRGLTFRMAQTPVQHYLPRLLKLVEEGRIDPSFVITDRASLQDGPNLYKKFRDKQDGCIKVVMKP
jgi:hypothetical protein